MDSVCEQQFSDLGFSTFCAKFKSWIFPKRTTYHKHGLWGISTQFMQFCFMYLLYSTLYCSLQVTVSMCEIESNLDTWQIVIPHIVSFNFLIFCKGKLPTKWIKKTRRWDVFSNNMKIHYNQYIYINCTNKYPINHYYANVSLLYVTLSKEIICL